MKRELRVVALVAAYNEEDVIGPVLAHLVDQGVEIYLLDHHSTDGTVREASRWLGKGLLAIESFPDESSASRFPEARRIFAWTDILRRKEELASELDADWLMHHDADELRESPWPGMSLRDAIREVDDLGYNCVDFRVFNFPPIDDGFQPGADPTLHFRRFEPAAIVDRVQRKCWKRQSVRVSLAAGGGHDVVFDGRRVFPLRFLMLHYPIRSQAHGLRKVLEERRARFSSEERARGWHVQYDAIVDERHSFLRDPSTLEPFDLATARLETLLENRPKPENRDSLEGDLRSTEVARRELEARCQALEQSFRETSEERARLETRARELEERIALFERRVAELEAERARLETRAIELASRLTESATRLVASETSTGALRRDLAAARTALAAARAELSSLYASRSWRWSAAVRALAAPFVRRP